MIMLTDYYDDDDDVRPSLHFESCRRELDDDDAVVHSRW